MERCGCGNDAGNNWFDRSLCESPCNSMHTRCRECGYPLDGCLFFELDDAVDELVTETERLATLAWSPDLHDNTVDTLTVEAAADHLKEQLGE